MAQFRFDTPQLDFGELSRVAAGSFIFALYLRALAKAPQRQFDTFTVKADHHVAANRYYRYSKGTAGDFSHFLQSCLVLGDVEGRKLNPFLRKELLCHLTMGSGRGGIDLYLLAHDNLLYLKPLRLS